MSIPNPMINKTGLSDIRPPGKLSGKSVIPARPESFCIKEGFPSSGNDKQDKRKSKREIFLLIPTLFFWMSPFCLSVSGNHIEHGNQSSHGHHTHWHIDLCIHDMVEFMAVKLPVTRAPCNDIHIT